MIFAYALLGEPVYRVNSLKVLAKVKEIWVPDSFRSEWASVLWQWVAQKKLSSDLAIINLNRAEALISHCVSSFDLWERALELAMAKKHSPYGTFFVALAESSGSVLISYDKKIKKLFPDWVLSPEEFLKLEK